jgi:transposase
LEAGKRGLVNGASDDNAYKTEIERFQKIIGKQAIQIEILKKTEELFGKR